MKMRFFIVFLIIITTILTACGTTTTAAQKEPLRVAYTDRSGDYVTLIGIRMGFFKQRGVSVEAVYYPTFSDSYTDLAIGKIDAINAVLIDILPAIKNNNMRAVMVTDSSEGGDSIVATPDISSIRDLRGKRIGAEFGTFGELLVLQMLARVGLTRQDVTLINVSPEEVPAAIPTLIDAGHTWEPHTAVAVANGDRILFSSKDTPGLFPEIMTFRAEVVKDRSGDVSAFVKGWFDAANYWITNPQAGNTIIAQVTGQLASEISTQGVRIYTLQDNLQAFEDNPGSNISSIYYVARLNLDFSIKAGYITIPPDLNILLDPSFLK
jgi:NitT/TauT family transport system substrate-binding protein